jgi:hypothetical protein
MVICTEYMGERYSMGSPDPLPVGFEIRFGSLNFQATWNGYLMRISNRAELHPWRPTGPGPVPAMPAVVAPAPAPSCAAGPSALDADTVLVNAHARQQRNDVGPRAPCHGVTRSLTKQHQHPRGRRDSRVTVPPRDV